MLLAALVVPGCAGDPAPISLEEFGALAPEAVCDWAVRCRHAPDRPTCERLLDPKDYDVRRAADSIAAGRTELDGAAAARCIAETREQFCLVGALTAPSCFEAFSGLVPEGGACTAGRECAGNGACEIDDCPGQCCTGRCGPPRVLVTGGADFGDVCEQHSDCRAEAYCETDRRCTRYPDAPGERCLFGCSRGDLFCDLETLTCVAFAGPGERCDPDGSSAPRCDPAWAVCDGVCRPRPGVGEPCDDQDRLCVPTAICDLAAGVCAPRREHGEPCDSGELCQDQCDLGVGICAPYGSCY